MKTKIAYVLTSDNSDIYLEQSFVSIYTLRKFDPDAYVVLAVDDITDKTLVGKRAYIFDYISEKVVITPPLDFTKVERSRYLKNSLREYITGDFLYIDSDTVICNKLDDIDYVIGDVCAIKDYHLPLLQHPMLDSLIRRQARIIGWSISNKDVSYFNGGVLLVKDTPKARNLFRRWNEEWIEGRNNGCVSDQPSLAKVNAELGYVITEIDGTWNCQVATNGLCFFENAKILHYFSSTIQKGEKDNVYSLMNVEVFKSIKETGIIDDEFKSMIDNPKTLFAKKLILLSGETLKVYQSPLVNYVYVLYKKYRKVYNFFNKILQMYGNRNK